MADRKKRRDQCVLTQNPCVGEILTGTPWRKCDNESSDETRAGCTLTHDGVLAGVGAEWRGGVLTARIESSVPVSVEADEVAAVRREHGGVAT